MQDKISGANEEMKAFANENLVGIWNCFGVVIAVAIGCLLSELPKIGRLCNKLVRWFKRLLRKACLAGLVAVQTKWFNEAE